MCTPAEKRDIKRLVNRQINGTSEEISLYDLFKDFFPPNYKRRLIGMLRGFFDASRTFASHKNPVPCITVAGFVGELKRLSNCQQKWREARKSAGIEFFHMTDYEARRKPYDTWSEQKRVAVLTRLINLTIKANQFAVAMTIPLASWNALDGAAKLKLADNPYVLCASWCMTAVVKWLDLQNIREEVAYVFETGDSEEFKDAISRILRTSNRFKGELKIHSITAGTKKEFPALDSADFLAWETTHHFPNFFS